MQIEATGTVVYLNTDKGYGFIQIPGYEKNVFFHAKDIKDRQFENVKRGDNLSVGRMDQNDKGFIARELRKA